MRAAAVQFAAVPFAVDVNLAAAERLIRQAARQGAQLIVLPELFNTGYAYSPRLTAAAEPLTGPTVARLQALSAELNVHLAGTLLLRDGGEVVNAFVLVQPNHRTAAGGTHIYSQRHPFLWEACYFTPGRAPLIVETALGRLGLLVCWDLTHPAAWAAYAGQVDAILIASAPVRFHRALLNFPAARKVYVAELMTTLLRHRRQLDELYGGYVGQCAAALGVPVVHAVMSGRFVAQLPYPRLSFLAAAAFKPHYWSWAKLAHQASLRASFYGSTAIYAADGHALATAPMDDGLAVADLPLGFPPHPPRPVPHAPVPWELRLFERLLWLFARAAYRRPNTDPAQRTAGLGRAGHRALPPAA